MTDHSIRHQLRRSVLFMPGDSLHKIGKATHLEVDSLVMDLEDGVALNRKEVARQTIREALQTLDFGPRERLIRLSSAHLDPNSSEGQYALTDLAATLDARPDGYVLPKVETAAQLRAIADYLDTAEQNRGWSMGVIRLLAVIETALGIMNLKEIASASPRLEALMFGAEDLAGSLGATRTPAGWEIFYARSAVVTAAAAYVLQAIDMVLTDLTDVERLEAECLSARQMGYFGKMAIHPGQVEVINRCFAPTPEEITQAQRLVQAYEAHQAMGTGAFELDGRMVDRPMVRAALNTLERARLAGLLE